MSLAKRRIMSRHESEETIEEQAEPVVEVRPE